MRLSNPFLEDGAILVLITEADAGWYLATLETRLKESADPPLLAAHRWSDACKIPLTLRGVVAALTALALVALAELVP